MKQRHLTITLQPDWRAALRSASVRAKATSYQGERLNFESPGVFFSRLSEKRWPWCTRCKGRAKWRSAS